MAKFIGRLVDVGFGKETVRGTAVAPGFWYPKLSADILDKVEKAFNKSGFGVIDEVTGSEIVRKFAEGKFEGKIRDKSIGLILLAAFGTVNSALKGGETIVYEHSFSRTNTNTHQSLTIAIKDSVENLAFVLGMLKNFNLECAIDDYAKFTAEFLSKASTTAANTVSYTAENEFRPLDITVKMADTISGLPGASAIKASSVKLNIDKDLEGYQAFGSQEYDEILNKTFKVKGEMELLFEDTTYKTLFTGNTKKAMSIDLKNTSVTIGNSSNPELYFELAQVRLHDWGKDYKNDDIVKQTVGFTAEYSLSDTKTLSAKLTNLQTSY